MTSETRHEPPLVVAIGGTTSPGSSTELVLRMAAALLEARGVTVRGYYGAFLAKMPHYDRNAVKGSAELAAYIDDIRQADGLIIASPGYHGAMSGIIKNALDYIEETARDGRVYLDGLPVGILTTAYGWQAAASTLTGLRNVVHALRGWPTPYGAALKISPASFVDGLCRDEEIASAVGIVAGQVMDFLGSRHRLALPETAGPGRR